MIDPTEAGCGDQILNDAALSIQGSQASTYPFLEEFILDISQMKMCETEQTYEK